MRRALKWIGWSLAGIVGVAVLGGVGGYLWLRTSLPQQDGTIHVGGLTAPVTVERDDRGVVTIRAQTRTDGYFALGFAHAQDRLFQMDLMRRVAAGRLAEVVGAEAVPTDKLMRTLGLYTMAEQQAEAAGPDLKSALDAYAAGVNAFLAQRSGALPIEFLLLRYKPEKWRPADSLAWGRIMALQLSANWAEERLNRTLQQSLPPELFQLLAPEAKQEAGLPPPFGKLNVASNNWVIAPSKSKSGAPVLANDPHLGLSAPSLWYFAHIVTPQMQWVGATSPGMPMLVIGANDRVAWGFTTTSGDTEDLFEEKPVANDPTRYLAAYGPAVFATRNETIKVKNGKDVTFAVRATHHGPVISDLDPDRKADDPIYALQAAFLQPNDHTPDALLAMNLATSAEQFRTALASFASPQQNVVFADRDGHIGFVAAGRVPVRRLVYANSLLPTPGWVDDYDWTGFIPFDGLPQASDPASGWLATANNKIVGDNFPFFIAGHWPNDGRYRRIAELLDAQPKLGVEDFEAMQMDTLSKPVRDLIQSWLPRVKDADPKITEMLKSWDGRAARDRPETLVATLWMARTSDLLLEHALGKSYDNSWVWDPEALRRLLADPKRCADNPQHARDCDDLLQKSLTMAVGELRQRLGSDPTQWKWGDLHRLHFRHPVLRHVPVLSHWLDADLPTDGDAFTLNRGVPAGNASTPDLPDVHGPTMRLIVDLKDPMQAVATLAGGQSGNPLSSHYADGLMDWRDGHYRPIVQPAVHRLTLAPGN